jgi:hypothetical protein
MDFASTRSRNCNQTTTELTNRCLGVDFIAKFSALLPDLLPITQFLGARSDHQANAPNTISKHVCNAPDRSMNNFRPRAYLARLIRLSG